jgi:hypothetical protein
MDPNRFDTLARSLTAARSRRAAVGVAIGSALGLLGVHMEPVEAHDLLTKCRKIDDKKKKRACIKKARAHDATHIVTPSPPPPPAPPTCTPDCSGGRDCGSNGCTGGSCGTCSGTDISCGGGGTAGVCGGWASVCPPGTTYCDLFNGTSKRCGDPSQDVPECFCAERSDGLGTACYRQEAGQATPLCDPDVSICQTDADCEALPNSTTNRCVKNGVCAGFSDCKDTICVKACVA